MSAIEEKIARVCHEANRAWCEANGDTSQPSWDDAPAWQRESALAGVLGAIDGNTPRQSHESWSASKVAAGWVYGDVKDPSATPPTHPCLVDYDQLPPEQKLKDHLFVAIVRALWPLPIAGATVVEQIAELDAAIRERQSEGWGDPRELAIALTHLEDCQMRFTRGRAKRTGVFKPVDLERVEARAERARFEDQAAEAAR